MSCTCKASHLSQASRTRLYCVLKDCPACNAKRGELCYSSKNKQWNSGFHFKRAQEIQEQRKLDPKFNAVYMRMRQQLIDEQLQSIANIP